MMADRKLTLVPYGRTSREQDRTIEEQERDYRATVERWHAGRPNITLLEWKFDHGKSGKSLKGRAHLDGALALVKSGDADGIVVPVASRLGRKLSESATAVEYLTMPTRQGGLGAVFVALDVQETENPNPDDPHAALQMWLWMAERELRRLDAQWYRRKRGWAQAGAHVGTAPLGYRTRKQKGKPPFLDPDPDTAAQVREAFRLAASGDVGAAARLLKLPPSKVAGEAPESIQGRPSKKGILRNEVYLGRTSWMDSRTGEKISVDGAHEPLTDLATFRRVQLVLSGNPIPRRAPSESYPLSAVPDVICGRCGRPLVGSLSGGKRDRPNSGTKMYRCSSHGGSGRAPRCGPFAGARAATFADLALELDPTTNTPATLESAIRAAMVRAAATERPGDTVVVRGGQTPDPRALEDAETVLASAKLRRDDDLRNLSLPPDALTIRLAAHDVAINAAQERYDASLAAAEPEITWPLTDEIVGAPVDQLASLLDRMDLRAVVAPERQPLAERVRLVPRDGS